MLFWLKNNLELTEMTKLKPFESHTFDVNHLLEKFPPQITNSNKLVIFDVGLKNHNASPGTIEYTCWSEVELPGSISKSNIELVHHNEFFTYPGSEKCIEWHMNFAHEELFGFYGGQLFAQDEIQVAEHPILACIRELILKDDLHRWTVKKGYATPILITGVERRCEIDLSADDLAGRPNGLYGNEFGLADEAVIKEATTAIEPPVKSNIIAMESPQPDSGLYTREQIEFILASAVTGFSAAVEVAKSINKDVKVSIHTGYWGCGAYGGNRELMALLQIIAGFISGVDILHFHTGDDSSGYFDALDTLDLILPEWESVPTKQLLNVILMFEYEWGRSDGN
jgi:hypothetical protein